MLSKTISTSRKVNKLSDRAALLYTWLIAHTDDYGRMEGDALSVRAKVVPMRNSSIDEVESDLVILEKDLIKRYTVKDEIFLELLNFDSFQTFRSDRPRRAEYPNELGQLPNDNQRYTTDIPMGDISQRKIREDKVSKGKLREDKISKDIYTSDFEEFWKQYPKRVGKPKAFDFWKRLKDLDRKLILEDIPKRLKSDSWINGFAHHPERYIRDRRWEDEIILPRMGKNITKPKTNYSDI